MAYYLLFFKIIVQIRTYKENSSMVLRAMSENSAIASIGSNVCGRKKERARVRSVLSNPTWLVTGGIYAAGLSKIGILRPTRFPLEGSVGEEA
jgi:hypothetical protein